MNGTEETCGDGPAADPNTPRQWRDFLRAYSALYIGAVHECQLRRDFDDEQIAEGWLGRTPATEENVADAERRLGVRFPPGYRSFLLTTNGWDAPGDWIDDVHSCEEVDWMRDTEEGGDLLSLYEDDGGDTDDDFVALLRRSLQVGFGEDVWLLDPADTAPDGEWAAYLFTVKYGEVEPHTNFAGLFRQSQDCVRMWSRTRTSEP